HTTIGGKILSGGRFALLKMAEEIALTHHERWDGTGYPHGLREATTPLAGRIVAVADAFDALTHERPYKEAWSVEEAVAELQRCAGTQLDPTIVDAFMGLRSDSLAAAVLGARTEVGAARLRAVAEHQGAESLFGRRERDVAVRVSALPDVPADRPMDFER